MSDGADSLECLRAVQRVARNYGVYKAHWYCFVTVHGPLCKL
jgi:hypothetical protein